MLASTAPTTPAPYPLRTSPVASATGAIMSPSLATPRAAKKSEKSRDHRPPDATDMSPGSLVMMGRSVADATCSGQPNYLCAQSSWP
ncbi:hypothetical protein GCM10009837_15630 [Streptomyces durmitorensis]